VVTKVEPPNWWIGITPELQLLVYGRNLEATHVGCNLPTLHVTRTQASAGGKYLFVWLKIAPDTRSGTAVCRIQTGTGETTFELPLAARLPKLGRFQGLAPEDAIYLIMPDRFANGDPTNDEPAAREAGDGQSRNDDSKSSRAGERNPAQGTATLDRAYHGDLRGVRDHLAYLKDLGVTTLSLTPIVKNGAPQDYRDGYGAVDLYAVDAHLGTLDDYRELVAAAHRQKIKILFDIAPNHVGPLHPWVHDPPLPDWFHGTVEHHLDSSAAADAALYGGPASTPGAGDPFETLADPHAPAALSRNLTDGWLLGILPDLNTENPAVAEYLLENAIWWTESSGLDGLRVDAFPYVPKRFWASWNAGLRAVYPYLTTVGEVFHGNPQVTSFFAGGQRRSDGIDSGVTTLLDFPLCFALRDVLLHDAPAGKIADILRQDGLYSHAENLVTFFGEHGQPRFSSGEYQSIEKLELAYGLVLTLRGIPELYYGDEIALPGGNHADNRRDFPGGWIGDARNAFTPSERTPRQEEMFSYAQSLLRLRREHVALQTGRLWHVFSDQTAYVFVRETEEEHLLVAFNNSNTPRTLRIKVNDTPLEMLPAAAAIFGAGTAEITKGELLLKLPPQAISIFNCY
jgi:glycosidase